MFELFSRLQSLGFTYDESAQLRRIEMTLQRWGERECGDASGNCIERDEVTGKPFVTFDRGNKPRGRYPVADREAGALRRLAAIVAARNERETTHGKVYEFHQGDCRGCNLYLVTHDQILGNDGTLLPLDQYYTRGLAVCA